MNFSRAHLQTGRLVTSKRRFSIRELIIQKYILLILKKKTHLHDDNRVGVHRRCPSRAVDQLQPQTLFQGRKYDNILTNVTSYPLRYPKFHLLWHSHRKTLPSSRTIGFTLQIKDKLNNSSPGHASSGLPNSYILFTHGKIL